MEVGTARKKLIAIVLGESTLAGLADGIAGIVLASLAVFPFSVLISEPLELPILTRWFSTSFPWSRGTFSFGSGRPSGLVFCSISNQPGGNVFYHAGGSMIASSNNIDNERLSCIPF
jgi:hypothetical protein